MIIVSYIWEKKQQGGRTDQGCSILESILPMTLAKNGLLLQTTFCKNMTDEHGEPSQSTTGKEAQCKKCNRTQPSRDLPGFQHQQQGNFIQVHRGTILP